MLSPAEEMGLSGLSLGSQVRKAFYKIPQPRLAELMKRMHEEAAARHLSYLRDGQPDTVYVMPCPLTVLPDQLAYIHYVSQLLNNALKRLPELYMQDFAVREALRCRPTKRSGSGTAGGQASARTIRSSGALTPSSTSSARCGRTRWCLSSRI
jgi:hypothetical protein